MAALDNDTTRIEREIAETRNRMTGTLGALERKLSVSRLGGGLVDVLSDAAADYQIGAKEIAETIWRNPVPVALIGVGLGWMLFDRRPRTRAEAAPSGADSSRTPRRGDPLILGALGLAAGALLGTLLPLSRREEEWLGEAHEALVREADALARTARERAREIVEHAGRAAVDAVEHDLGLDQPQLAGAATENRPENRPA